MRKPSDKRLLDDLVDAVQNVDSYYGRSNGRKDEKLRELEIAYKAARRALRERLNDKRINTAMKESK